MSTIEEKATMDRRQFIGAAGLGTALLAGAGLFSSSAKAFADEAAAEDAAATESGSDPEKVGPIPPVDVPESWGKEADVVIVGSGGGGLNAAARASQLGLTAIVLEKSSMIGGNSRSATMFTIGGGTDAQNEVEFATPSYPYDVNAWVRHMMMGMGQGGNPEMLQLIGSNLAPCFNWMTETYGLEWTMGPNASYFYVQADGMDKIIDAAYDYNVAQGVEFLTECEAKALVMDGDRVVGVKAATADGDVYCHGVKGVILTGGGFAANPDMLAEYCPTALKRAKACYLSMSDSGECFRMGLGAGAEITNRDSFTMFDGGMDWREFGGYWCHYLFDGATQIVRQPWLSIRSDGSRIPYIDIMESMGALTDLAVTQTSAPDATTYVIFDGKWDDYIKGMDNYAAGFLQYECRMPVQDGMYKQECMPEYYQDYHAGMQDAIDMGVIRECDTLEELAESLGLNPDVLQASVDKWNAMVETGHDDYPIPLKDQWLHPITEPPFYGAKLGGFLFMTQTGLLINPSMQVISTEGKVIPGLYAGWHTAGGAAADNVITSMSFDTGGVSKSYLGGYLAAQAVAELEA